MKSSNLHKSLCRYDTVRSYVPCFSLTAGKRDPVTVWITINVMNNNPVMFVPLIHFDARYAIGSSFFTAAAYSRFDSRDRRPRDQEWFRASLVRRIHRLRTLLGELAIKRDHLAFHAGFMPLTRQTLQNALLRYTDNIRVVLYNSLVTPGTRTCSLSSNAVYMFAILRKRNQNYGRTKRKAE